MGSGDRENNAAEQPNQIAESHLRFQKALSNETGNVRTLELSIRWPWAAAAGRSIQHGALRKEFVGMTSNPHQSSHRDPARDLWAHRHRGGDNLPVPTPLQDPTQRSARPTLPAASAGRPLLSHLLVWALETAPPGIVSQLLVSCPHLNH